MDSQENTTVEATDEVETEELEGTENAPEDLTGLKNTVRATRQELRELRAENARLRAAQSKPADDDDVRTQVRAEIAQEFARELAREKAMTVLTEYGFNGNLERGVRMLDLDSVIVDGKVDKDGLRDLVEELKDDSPKLFRRTRTRDEVEDDDEESPRSTVAAGRPGSADIGKKTPVKKAKTAAEILAEKRFGKVT